MKKILVLLMVTFLSVSCSGNKNRVENEEFIKDTNGFDILMGQFAHNIENIWGLNEVLIAGPKDYVKYTDQYQTRSHINFDAGTLTVETIAPATHLRQAIITTLLMGDDPGSIDLYSGTDSIRSSKEPFLYGQVLDNHHQPIRWERQAAQFADYLLQTKMQKRGAGLRVIWSVTLQLVPNHVDKRAHKYLPLVRKSAIKYGVEGSLILAVMHVESNFNPYAVSGSDALGLMQVVRHTSGRDVFRMKGKRGQPSRHYLFEPESNIDVGAAYLSMLQNNYLREIKNATSRRYAVIAAYNGGASSVLRVFSNDRKQAFSMINRMEPWEVFHALTTQHPSSESRRYLLKVNSAQKSYRRW